MPRLKETEPLTKVKINLFERDYERLKVAYPLQGPARVIRALVRAHVARIDARTSVVDLAEQIAGLEGFGDLDLELEETEIA